MEDDLSASDALNENHVNPNLILTDWLVAVDRLHRYYQQLTSLLTKETGQKGQQAAFYNDDRYVGQCPLNRLLTLQARIEGELARLLQEMNHRGQEPTLASKHKKLASHTHVLNQLNQRAQIKLLLANLPLLE